MKTYLILTVLLMCVALSACGPAPTPMDFASVCTPQNDGKSAVVTGYLFDDGHIFCSNIGGSRMECSLRFKGTLDGDKSFGAEIAEGNWANDIEKVESSYKKEDIKVHDSTGAIISLTDKVKITGKISTTPDDSVCFVTVRNIEKQ